jgi:hypothetical protein
VKKDIQKHYRRLAESADILESATSHTWELQNTGGGCTAWVLYVRDGFFMLTDEGASAPEPSEMGDIVLGFYSHELLDDVTIFDDVSDLETLSVFFARWNNGGR